MPSGTGKTISLLSLIVAYQRVSMPRSDGEPAAQTVQAGWLLVRPVLERLAFSCLWKPSTPLCCPMEKIARGQGWPNVLAFWAMCGTFQKAPCAGPKCAQASSSQTGSFSRERWSCCSDAAEPHIPCAVWESVCIHPCSMLPLRTGVQINRGRLGHPKLLYSSPHLSLCIFFCIIFA